eukprot:6597134-Pyramimonas_sp.AAC.1
MPHEHVQTDASADLGDDCSFFPRRDPKQRYIIQSALRRAALGRASPPSSNRARKKIATAFARLGKQQTLPCKRPVRKHVAHPIGANGSICQAPRRDERRPAASGGSD